MDLNCSIVLCYIVCSIYFRFYLGNNSIVVVCIDTFLSVINLCRALKCRNGEWWKPAASLGICLGVIVSHFVEPDIVHYINKSIIIR